MDLVAVKRARPYLVRATVAGLIALGGLIAVGVRIVGYAIVLLALLGAFKVPLGGLLLGGAVTGVVIGIAAQQTLGNFFAGIVLLIVRPFAVGDSVVLRSGPLGGEYEGTVSEISLYYVNVVT